jgi:NADPH:quinone reductase-like Zn-dependent oxidoreductase
MKALRIHEFGSWDKVRWEEVAEPCLTGPDDVKIRVKCGALNHLDIWVREKIPGVPVDLPLIQGCDASGEVVDLGEGVRHVARGDRVFLQPGYGCGQCSCCLAGQIHYCRHYGIYGETTQGNFADYVVRPKTHVFKIPNGMTYAQAAAFPLVTLTAWEMLVNKARLKANETLLVLGASSGVGSMALQIGKWLRARVVAITSGDTFCSRARDLGADEVIDRLEETKFSKIFKNFSSKGADVVFEHTGEATFQESLKCLGQGGRMLICGGTTGPRLTIDVRYLFSKQWQILGSTMGPLEAFYEMIPCFEKGQLQAVIGLEMPMAEGAKAQKILEEGKVFGKIVLNNES